MTVYDDDITPTGVIRETWRWFPAAVVVTIAVLLLGGGITLVGWQANWWFQAHDATRQAQNTQNGYANQTTLRAQITEKLSEVTTVTTQIAASKGDANLVSALEAQRAGIAEIACGDAAQISGTPLPAQQAQWVSVNCQAGALAPSSPDYVTGAP